MMSAMGYIRIDSDGERGPTVAWDKCRNCGAPFDTKLGAQQETKTITCEHCKAQLIVKVPR